MKKVPLDAILSNNVDQKIIDLIMGQRKDFTQKQILEKVTILFSFVVRSELNDEVKKVLSELLQTGAIRIYSQTCTPDKEVSYIVNQ